MNDYWQSRIDTYLRNEMVKDDRIWFEKEMRKDDALRQEVELNRIIIDRLSKRQEKLDAIKKWQSKRKQRKTTYTSLVSIGIAASLIFGSFLIKPMLLKTDDSSIPLSPSIDIQDKSYSVEPMMKSPENINKTDSIMIDSIEDSKGKHCTYTIDCRCSGFVPKSDGKEWEKSYCKKCGHHIDYHNREYK